ncbi:integrase arm-type DNA-binding domain-containing protein [Halothiobacillus sp.]|uniref:tyrosine-type recombinase/integrase n=1 Tax=Halothiobacillus sp. TaxID=1891311 RepID=UPI002621BAF7|nr:integrase arm-type DNA-binding domain-containing protein [Halothiobacillus sp.]
MPRLAKELTAIEVKRLTVNTNAEGVPYNTMHRVGGVSGLMLQITPSGAKSWLLRTYVGEKRRSIGLGGFPDVSLADARTKAQAVKDQIELGLDPIETKRAARRALIDSQRQTITFEDAARRYIEMKAKEFKNPRQAEQWTSSLTAYAFPIIGGVPVRDIELTHIKAVLDPIWERINETANRVRGRIENILGWATIHQYRTGENPARWTNYLDQIYAAPGKIQKVKHHEAMPFADVPAFMAELRQRDGLAARALEFTILTATRTNEGVGDKRIHKPGATWGEIDTDKRLWTIPAERMKAGRAHQVPLSDAAMKVLAGLARGDDAALIFPGAGGAIASNNFLSSVLKRMGQQVTAHGFRSSFKDWARNLTAFDDEVSELALAHISNDLTRAAYARDGLIEKRRQLMTDWAHYCEHGQQTKSNVIAIGERRA